MIYLASPYYHPDPDVMQARYEQMLDVVAHYLRGGFPVFSPIVHCHNVKLKHDLPNEHEFWLTYDLKILRWCQSLHIIMQHGWELSRGIQQEVDFANSLKILIHHVNVSEILG